jgi:transcriptional regulator GlxA family with amidase domain
MNSVPPLEPSSGRSRFEVHRLHVAVIVFPDVEELDFAGPFGVFAAVNDVGMEPGLHVFSVAETPSSIRARHGLRIVPDFTFERCPRPDILVIPGGSGTRLLVDRPSILEWVRTRSHTAKATLGVCTGTRILAKAGLMAGPTATAIDPRNHFHDLPHPTGAGRLITAAGLTAGLDASLHVIDTLLGPDAGACVSRHLGYTRSPDAGDR